MREGAVDLQKHIHGNGDQSGGAGRCLQCKAFLSIRFNEEKQEMELTKFERGSSNESIGGDLQ